MPDHNDIDALLAELTLAVNQHWITIPRGVAADYHAALTALVAERDALRERVAELESQPPADRDLRERLVCAALTGILSNSDFKLGEEDSALCVVLYADATLAAMRKGDECNR